MIGLHYKSRVIAVALTLLMLATSAMALDIHIVPVVHASSVIIVPDDYPTIQDAIGNASAGDTVYVRAGTYYGGLSIDKPLTLKGENRETTTVVLSFSPSPRTGVGLWIGASNVSVSGFHFITTTDIVCMIAIDGRISVVCNDVFMDNVVQDVGPPDPIVAISSQGTKIVGNIVLSEGSGLNSASTISLVGADNCLIAENNVTGGYVGILVIGNDNVVGLNYVANTTDFFGMQQGGILLDMGINNTVVSNTLVGNAYGVSCWSSNNNVIYHNNLIDNQHQAYSSSLNAWDYGYPSGGNYWSDYNGTDSLSGPFQNVTGSDGIGDTPMIGGSNVVDHYPLMQPVGDVVGDVNLDGKVDIKDIAAVAHCFGLTAGSVGWNPLADVNGDGRIDIADIALVARNFGKSWLAPVSVGPPITSPTNNSFVITASDSSDPYLRDWAVTFDRPMVTRQDSGYVGADSHEYHFSGDTMTVQWTLSAGPHYLMFIVSQVGGSSYGTYSGTININGQMYSFSGVDGTDPVRIDFTV